MSLPNGWEVKNFKDVLEDVTGGNKKIQGKDYLENGLFSIVDQGSNLIGGFTNDKTSIVNTKIPLIIFGDHTRVFKYIDFTFAIGADGVKILSPKVNLNMKYLYYFFISKPDKVPNTGYNRHFKYLKDVNIPIPPIKEQQKIASILERADNLRRKRKEANKLFDELLQSVFLEIFGDPTENPKQYPIENLEEISDIVSGVTKGKNIGNKETFSVPYMRVANVQDGHINLDEIKYIDAIKSDIEKYTLMNRDILLTEGGDPDKLGRGAVWYNEIPNCIHQNHIFRVRVKSESKIIPEYLSSLIGSNYGKLYFLRAAKQTTGIATINSSQLKKFPVLIPQLDEQEKYLNSIIMINKIKEKAKESEKEIEDLFNSLMQNAFNGQLDLTDYEVIEKELVSV